MNPGIQNLTTAARASGSHAALRPDEARDLAPVGLFVYNRPEHTRRTLEALKVNEFAARTDLFVFSDGAKIEAAEASVREVREISRDINGFKSVTVIERERNLGLSKSIVAGITQLCEEYGRAIAVEDDVLTAPDFLTFMNRALDRYEGDPMIFSISGFNLPIPGPPSYPFDAFCSYRFLCWGWGTWRDRWQQADWSVSDYREFVADSEQQKRFNRGGDDLTAMLGQHMAGKIDSWDVVWGYAHCKHNAFSLLPVVSKAYNTGLDGSGVHCRRPPFRQSPLRLDGSCDYRFPELIEPHTYFVAQIQQRRRLSIARKFMQFMRQIVPPTKRLNSSEFPRTIASDRGHSSGVSKDVGD